MKSPCCNCFTCVKNTIYCPLHPQYSEEQSRIYWTEKLLGKTKASEPPKDEGQ